MQGIYENFYFINIKMDSESLCVFPKVAELLSNSVFTRAQPFLARVIFTRLFRFINDIYYLLNIQNVSGTVWEVLLGLSHLIFITSLSDRVNYYLHYIPHVVILQGPERVKVWSQPQT